MELPEYIANIRHKQHPLYYRGCGDRKWAWPQLFCAGACGFFSNFPPKYKILDETLTGGVWSRTWLSGWATIAGVTEDESHEVEQSVTVCAVVSPESRSNKLATLVEKLIDWVEMLGAKAIWPKRPGNGGHGRADTQTDMYTCWNCGRKSHLARLCRSP